MAPNMQESSVLMLCPSFNSYNSIRFAEIAHKVSREFSYEIEDFGLDSWDFSSIEQVEEEEIELQFSKEYYHNQQTEDAEEEDDDFEFNCVCRDHESLAISTADEIFFNGQIRPVDPLFNQNLLLEDSKPRIDSLRKLFLDDMPTPESDTLKQRWFPAGVYCICLPKQQQTSAERCKKSNSTGTSKRWRLKDLITRRNSDGKESIVFLDCTANSSSKKKEDKKTEVWKKEKRSSSDPNVSGKITTITTTNNGAVKSAHEIQYVRNRALREMDRRRTFLPYRKDIIGFLAIVNGLKKQPIRSRIIANHTTQLLF